MAREAGFHPSQLYGWRRRLRARREAVPEFAAVRIAAEPAPSEMPATGTIEVEFAKGSRVRITGPDDVFAGEGNDCGHCEGGTGAARNRGEDIHNA